MAEYSDRFWQSRDGLKLHFRDYAGRGDRPPLVCLHGLTRNARDFAALADRLAGEWRVLCPEMRGRGESDYAREAASYNPLQYVQDLGELLAQEGIESFVAVGTSMGGLMTMVQAMIAPQLIAGAVLNDIGPVLEPAGMARILEYVGQGRSFPTWMHAARALEEMQSAAFPGYAITDWLAMAKRVMTITTNGRIAYDYDMKIAEPFEAFDAEGQADLWPGVDALSGKPVLIVRGELSDLFSEATMSEMAHRLPGCETVTVPGIGHAPMLDEPEAAAAIDRLLARIS